MTTKTKAPTIEAARSSNADKLPSASTCAVGGANGASIKPGVFRGMKAADYHAIDAFSNSFAGHMLRSPMHAQEYRRNPPEPTPSMVLGTAVDAILFDRLDEIAVAPECDRRTTIGKEKWASFVASSAGRQVVKAEQYEAATAMAKNVREHPAAASILSKLKSADMQVAVVWRDEETGILCKGLLDMLAASRGLLGDLKSTADAGPSEFPKSIFNFGYARQGAMYAEGLAANGVTIEDFAIIAVENEAPYAVAVYRLRDEDLLRGLGQFRKAINLYAECVRTGEWRGYSDEIMDISLPQWAARQLDQGNFQ